MTWTRAEVLRHVDTALDRYRKCYLEGLLDEQSRAIVRRELGERLDVDELERSPVPYCLPDAVKAKLQRTRGRR